MTEAETDKEAMRQELTELLGLTPEAMEYPRLNGTTLQTKDIVERTHTMQYQGQPMGLAQQDLCLEGCKLKVVGSGTDAIEAALTDKERGTGNGRCNLGTMTCRKSLLYISLHLRELRRQAITNEPWVNAKGRNGLLVLTERRMGMNIQEGRHDNSAGEEVQWRY